MSIQSNKNTKFFVELGDLLWEIPISDYSFSQELEQATIHRNELSTTGGGFTNRTTATENTGLAPGNWSVTVPAKYIKTSGSGTGKISPAANQHYAVEQALWAMMASDRVPESYDTVNLSSLPEFNQSTWSRSHLGSSAGGTGGGFTNSYYNSTDNFLDIYVVGAGQYVTGWQSYDTDFDWTITFAGGGSPFTIPRGFTEGYQSGSRPLLRDVEFDGGPCFFVQSTNRYTTKDATVRSTFLISIFFPDGTTPGAFMAAHGDFTVSATAKRDAVLQGVMNVDDYWQMMFRYSNLEQLLTGNMYFVTEKPTATVVSGTTNSNNTLLISERKGHGWSTAYNEGVDFSLFKPGHIHRAGPATLHYGAKEPTISNSSWVWQGRVDLDGDGSIDDEALDQALMNFPTHIKRKTTAGDHTFTVDSATGAWTDESGDTFKAPGMRVVLGPNILKGFSLKSKQPAINTVVGGQVVNSSSEHTGFRRGDHLVIAAGTLDDNGVALNEEFRLQVQTAGQGTFHDEAVMRFIGWSYNSGTAGVGQFDAAFGYNDPTWIESNDLFIESQAQSGTVTAYTEHADSQDDLRVITEATTDTSAYNGVNVINLTAVKSTIQIQDRLESDQLLASQAVYVVGITTISGSPDFSRITLSDNITLTASSNITFKGWIDKAGLTQDNTWRWWSTGNKNVIAVRDAITPSGNASSYNSYYNIYRSRGKNIGGSAVFKLENCCVNSATMDFSIDSTTSVTFEGYVKEIHHEAENFTFGSSAPSNPSANDIFYDTDNDQVQIRNKGNTSWRDCFTEGVQDTDNFVANKLGRVSLRPLDEVNTYPSVRLEISNFQPTAYDYQAGISGLYYGGLAGTNGMTANVANRLIYFDDVLDLVTSTNYGAGGAPATDNSWMHNYDWALEIDGTTYSGSSFVGLEAWNKSGAHITTLRGVSEFGKFAILKNNTPNVNNALLVFSTATNTVYNTQAKLNAADIALIGTPKAGLPVSETIHVPIIGGSMTISNNLTMISRNELGKFNRPESHIAGPRTVTGSFNMYLDENSMKIRDLVQTQMNQVTFEDKIGSHTFNRAYANPTQYQINCGMGNIVKRTKSIGFVLPQATLQLPSIEVGDVFSTTLNFVSTETFYSLRDATAGGASSGYVGNDLHLFYRG